MVAAQHVPRIERGNVIVLIRHLVLICCLTSISSARSAASIDEQAILASLQFIEQAGLRAPTDTPRVELPSDGISSITVEFKDYLLLLRTSESMVRPVHFRNLRVMAERVQNPESRAQSALMGRGAALGALGRLQSSLFPSRNLMIAESDFEPEGSPSAGRLVGHIDDKCGCARARWSDVEPEGAVFGMARSVELTIDLLHGTLLLAWVSHPDYDITSRNGGVDESASRAKAKAVALAQFGVDMAAYEVVATQGFAGVTKLAGVERPKRVGGPPEVRFAWRVRAVGVRNGNQVRDLFVDIDAQTSEVLNLGWLKHDPDSR